MYAHGDLRWWRPGVGLIGNYELSDMGPVDQLGFSERTICSPNL